MHFKISSAICFSSDQSKILSSENGLIKALIVLRGQDICMHLNIRLCERKRTVRTEYLPTRTFMRSSGSHKSEPRNDKNDGKMHQDVIHRFNYVKVDLTRKLYFEAEQIFHLIMNENQHGDSQSSN